MCSRKFSCLDDLVISGLSGRFPSSNNVSSFIKGLFNATDLVIGGNDRFPAGCYDFPQCAGTVLDLEKFDASFFKINDFEANHMDVQLRKLLEVTYEAIIDSGCTLTELSGTKTGFFYGSSFQETDMAFSDDPITIPAYFQPYSTIISKFFNIRGPIGQYDTACGSSFSALAEAFTAIRSGACEAALVAGYNICLIPAITLQFRDLKMISYSGKSKCLDEKVDGYGRSEAVCCIFLQKIQHAKRFYAKVINTRCNSDGYKVQGISFPSVDLQTALIRETYEEAKIDPSTVLYVEAHTTGTKAGDPVELGAIYNVFCTPSRTTPLLIGCLKSNIGHSEAASGLCAMIKSCSIFQLSKIPPNINYKKPNPSIKAINDGSIVPVTKPTPFDGSIISLNCFGFGGANSHVIISKNPLRSTDNDYFIGPTVIPVCGRTPEAVKYLQNFLALNKHKITKQFLYLLANYTNSHDMKYRGYSILLNEKILPFSDSNNVADILNFPSQEYNSKPLYFVLPELKGSKAYIDMSVMSIPSFSSTISRLSSYLNLPLEAYITDTKQQITLTEILLSFVTIQIALLNVLSAYGIKPTRVIGQFMSELATAYIESRLTEEETINAAYWYGQVIENKKNCQFQIAKINQDWQTLKKYCPRNIHLIWRSKEVTYVCGSLSEIQYFVNLLQKKCIKISILNQFDTEYSFSNDNPEQMNGESKISNVSSDLKNSKNYFSLKPAISFYESLSQLPSCTVLSLGVFKTNHSQNISSIILPIENLNLTTLLSTIGQLYTSGQSVRPPYPITYPIPVDTLSLHSLIQWDHSKNWKVYKFPDYHNPFKRSIFIYCVNLSTAEDWFFVDHCIDGRILFPAAGLLMLAWAALCRYHEINPMSYGVKFSNVRFVRATVISDSDTKFIVQYISSSGSFTILESGQIVCKGYIFYGKNISTDNYISHASFLDPENFDFCLSNQEIYKELRIRGYDYGPTFRALQTVHSKGLYGQILWKNTSKINLHSRSVIEKLEEVNWSFLRNWIPFTDSFFQILLFSYERALFIPTSIETLIIDQSFHKYLSIVKENNSSTDPVILAKYDTFTDILMVPGMVAKGLKASYALRKTPIVTNEEYIFIPRIECFHLQQVDQYYQLIKEVKQNPDTLIPSNINLSDAQYALLSKAKENKNNLDFSKDLLAGIDSALFTNERFVRPLLEIVLTTLLNKDITPLCRFTEINLSNPISEKIKHYLDLISLEYLEIQYFFCGNHDNDIVEKIRWDGKSSLPKEVTSNDCVILKHNPSFDISFYIEEIIASIKSNGFLLIFANESFDEIQIGTPSHIFENFLKTYPLTLIAKKKVSCSSIYALMYRKQDVSFEPKPTHIKVSCDNFHWVEKLKHTLCQDSNDPIYLTSDSPFSGLSGLAKSLSMEKGGQRIRVITKSHSLSMNLDFINFNNEPFKTILKSDLPINVITSSGLGQYHHLTMPYKLVDDPSCRAEASDVHLMPLLPGDLSSLKWLQSHIPLKSRNKIKVAYAALNFKDVMIATGRLTFDIFVNASSAISKDESLLGIEFSGIDSNNNRVMGIIPNKAIATNIEAHSLFTWPVPESWSLEEAATVPVVYATCYYALIIRGKIQKGESILIHAGSGGIGLAAISIALSFRCTVFTTVGTDKKREFVQSLYPLKDSQFANSRDTSFEEHIMRETNGKGVNIVLNSLAEDKLQASLRCLSDDGRFIEIGKFDMAENNLLTLESLNKSITFHGVILETLMNEFSNRKECEKLYSLLEEGIKTNVVKPLPRTVFEMCDVEKAFRFMASGKHMGKVLIRINNSRDKKINAIRKVEFSPNHTYVIVGGFGGIGLELSLWLAKRGARNILLNSRRGPTTNYHKYCIELLKNLGVNVKISTYDASTLEGAKNLLSAASEPIDGIFNCALVLNDALFTDHSPETFCKATDCKIRVTLNLNALTRNIPLTYFVVFSSVVSGRGNIGQSNYALANSAMEDCIEARRAEGLPGLAIQWGMLADVGYVAETLGQGIKHVRGTYGQRVHSCLATLDRIIGGPHSIVSSFVRYTSQRKMTVYDNDIVKSLVHILGITNSAQIDFNKKMSDLGIDSLMAVEIKQILEREFNVSLSTQQIRSMTVSDLKELTKSKSVSSSVSQKLDLPKEYLTVSLDKATTMLNKGVGKPIFFFPPIEGNYDNIICLAEKLSRPAIGLNWTYELLDKSLDTIIEYYISLMKNVQGDLEDFHVIAYSFGGLIASRIGKVLEEKSGPKFSKLVLLDADLKSLRVTLDNLENEHNYGNDNELKEVSFLVQTIKRVINEFQGMDELKEKLLKMNNEERFNKVAEVLEESGFEKKSSEQIIKSTKLILNKAQIFRTFKEDDAYLSNKISLRPNNSDFSKFEVIRNMDDEKFFDGNHNNYISKNVDEIFSIVDKYLNGQ